MNSFAIKLKFIGANEDEHYVGTLKDAFGPILTKTFVGAHIDSQENVTAVADSIVRNYTKIYTERKEVITRVRSVVRHIADVLAAHKAKGHTVKAVLEIVEVVSQPTHLPVREIEQ